MEYIVVRIAGQPDAKADVLINGEHNGETGALLTLGGPGWVVVSVAQPDARESEVEVRNTTASKPMEVAVKCA